VGAAGEQAYGHAPGVDVRLGSGAVLIAINHGDALLRGELDPLRLVRMGLTVIVPYCVSTASSVQALSGVARPTPPPG